MPFFRPATYVLSALLLTVPFGAQAVVLTLGQGATIDFDSNGTDDLLGYACCGNRTALRGINGTLRGYTSEDWEDIDLANAQSSSYNQDPSDGGALPEPGGIILYQTPDDNFYKLRATGESTSAGMPLEYEFLGSGSLPIPVAAFSWSSHDVVVDFTDLSSNSPSNWSWDFGDGGSSTHPAPQHAFPAGGTYNVCLVATNIGGDSTPYCENVTVTELPSTFVAAGNGIDFDNDGLDDLLVEPFGCTPNRMTQQNGAATAVITQDYASVTLTDAQALSLSTGPFCNTEGIYSETIVINASSGFFYKAWTPNNNDGGIRFIYELLGTPPEPPVAAFSFTTFDRIVFLSDQSTGTPTQRSWNFGDGNNSTHISPQHPFLSDGTFNVCLTAGNAGGSDVACQDITVAARPSVIIASGNGVDFDNDGLDELGSEVDGCGGANNLIPQPGADVGHESKFYPDVDINDAQLATYGSGPFCGNVADPSSTWLVTTTDGYYVKFWIAANSATEQRLEFEILGELADTTPEPFTYTSQVDVPLSDLRVSDPITVSDINQAVAISASGGQYSVNDGTFTTSNGTVEVGDSVRVRHTSSELFSTDTVTTLTIGGVQGTFTSTTLAVDQDPDAFAIPAQSDVDIDSWIESDPITVTGINTSVPIAVTGGEFSIDAGPYTSANGQTVSENQEVRVRVMSSPNYGETTQMSLDIGSVNADFVVTTLSNPHADLGVSLGDSADPVASGASLSYAAAVRNDGPVEALDVVLDLVMPMGVSNATTSGCAEDPTAFPTCTIGTLAADAETTITISMDVDQGTGGNSIGLMASIAGSTPDDNADNDSALEDTEVNIQADLTIEKVSEGNWVPSMGHPVYTITVANMGPSDVLNAIVTDFPPARLGNVVWSCQADVDALCTANGIDLIDDLVSLPVGTSVVYTLEGDIMDSLELPITNQAAVAAPAGVVELLPSNNSDADTDAVGTFADDFESR